VQHVRREARLRLRIERRALAHAEPVLLVDDGERERAKCTGSSISAWVPTTSDSSPLCRRASSCAAPRRRRRARQQRERHRLGPEQRLDRREVLLGERLGRRHQRRLGAALDGAEHRKQRDDGLAAADLAHQQALRRLRSRELLPRAPRSPPAGQPVSSNGSPCSSQRAVSEAGSGSASARVSAAPRAALQQRELQQQQLLEGEPLTRQLDIIGSAPKCIASSAAPRAGSRSAARSRPGSGSTTSPGQRGPGRISARIWVLERPSVAA
jgi:hypothetical protein